MDKCIGIYESQGRFQQAGRILKERADTLEADFKNDDALVAFKRAADYFSMESTNAKSFEQQCLLKYADLLNLTNNQKAFEESKAVNIIKFI